eukprot:jgi/Hompol1/3207/HPOL_006406-RA
MADDNDADTTTLGTTALPEWFDAFLTANGIDRRLYIEPLQPPLPRYIRLKPLPSKAEETAAVETICRELGVEVKPVDWLAPDFYELSADVRIATAPSFKAGLFHGIDASSGVVVRALDLLADDHVLDMCCAPGGKLCYIADLIGTSGTGTVTGVDLSESRLLNTKSFVKKHRYQKLRLFKGDATVFDVHPPSRVGPNVLFSLHPKSPVSQASSKRTSDATSVCELGPLKRIKSDLDGSAQAAQAASDALDNQATIEHGSLPGSPKTSVKPFHATRMLLNDPQIKDSGYLYSKVLVDAECSTDGSITHIQNCSWKGWDGLKNAWMGSPEKLDELEQLQRALLLNGFRLLRPGGTLVYSTCSFSKRQNEDIVAWFLKQPQGSSAKLIPIAGIEAMPTAPTMINGYEDIPGIQHLARFSPAASRTSGMFIAKLCKQPVQ